MLDPLLDYRGMTFERFLGSTIARQSDQRNTYVGLHNVRRSIREIVENR